MHTTNRSYAQPIERISKRSQTAELCEIDQIPGELLANSARRFPSVTWAVRHRLNVQMRKGLAKLVLICLLCGTAAFAQKLDLALGWDYNDAKQPTGTTVLNGWFGSLTYNIVPRLGITLLQENYWGGPKYQRENDHEWLGGVTVQLASNERRIIPFIQPTFGVDRSSSTGSVDDNFTFQLAAGANIKLKGPVSLQLEPGVYVVTYIHGIEYNSYSANVGFQFSFK